MSSAESANAARPQVGAGALPCLLLFPSGGSFGLSSLVGLAVRDWTRAAVARACLPC
mgnify:CR=1 FL=1